MIFTKLLKISLIVFSTITFAQQTKILTDFKIKSSSFDIVNYDDSYLNIYYKMSSSYKKDAVTKSAESTCILQIGNNFSKFTDLSNLKLDSLKSEFSKMDYVGAKEMNLMFQYRPLWAGATVKDIKNAEAVQQNNIAGRLYKYEEPIPDFNWKLIEETKTILGYSCKKATVKYRGRNYTAWYALELPINNGPYIFQQLPGLILDLQDDGSYVHFTAVAIDKVPQKIYLQKNKNLLNVSRDKFREVKKNYFENPAAFLSGKAFNQDGTQIVVKPNSKKIYDPLELE